MMDHSKSSSSELKDNHCISDKEYKMLANSLNVDKGILDIVTLFNVDCVWPKGHVKRMQ